MRVANGACLFRNQDALADVRGVDHDFDGRNTSVRVAALDARRWLTTARRTAASCKRICFCSGGGKIAMIRLMVSTASSVCNVENTMWPVSAARRAVPMVSDHAFRRRG